MREPAGVLAILAAYRSGTAHPDDVCRIAYKRACIESLPVWTSCISESHLHEQLARLASHSPESLPLYGIPFAVKDNIDARALPTTAACPAHFAYQPDKDAAVVARLLQAGAILIGKTNMDQFATGLVGTRSPFGVVKNVFDPERISGGSSSGSAVAVASGTVPFALGTDTAGSGRVPAAFNNVVGLKPTPGRIPTDGVVPACRSLDCVSIFALSAADAAFVLAVIEDRNLRPDVAHPYSHGPTTFVCTQLSSSDNPSKLRVGIPSSLVSHIEKDFREAFEWSCEQMRDALDAVLVPLDFQQLVGAGKMLYDGPWVAERYAAVGSFIEQHPDAVHSVVRDIIMSGKSLSAADAFTGQYRLLTLKEQLQTLWEKVDILMVPTAPSLPTIEAVSQDPVALNAELGSYTNFVNLMGWSALAIPSRILKGAGKESCKPFGITWIAQAGFDAALLDLGVKWQKEVHLEPAFGCLSPDLVDVQVDIPVPNPVWPISRSEIKIAVVGAHLMGMPLNYQLVERQARFVRKARTANTYKLYDLPSANPPKPGLVRVHNGGAGIQVEIYSLPEETIGSLLALIRHPLTLGSIEMDSDEWVHGFLCDANAVQNAVDITEYGGWRSYMLVRKERIVA